jgi:CheY-like chemotaxis protein
MNGQARLVVSDTGVGIDLDFLPYVFDRFRQADSSITRRHGGLGLGLAIVRHIIEQHGGSVRAESAGPGHGASFIVELPISTTERADVGVAPPAARKRPLQGTRVLVVDDEPDARELVTVILEQAGAEVVAAPSARAALAAIADWHPTVLVTDIGMPEQDGYALLAELRRRGVKIPALAVTAYGQVEDRERALRAGFQLHLPKPVEPAVLVDAVRALGNVAAAP